MKKFIFLSLMFSFVKVLAATPSFEGICHQLLQKNPTLPNYETLFAPEFRRQIPLQTLTSHFAGFYAQTGACQSFKVTPTALQRFLLQLQTESGLELSFSVVFDDALGVFTGLSLKEIQDPRVKISSWKDVKSALQQIDPQGKHGATLISEDGKILFHDNSDAAFAVGSTFKLYILGALFKSVQQKEHRWDEELPLREEWKSLPSGIMHTWPTGQPVKLLEYAEKMISISDNTATDHLLFFLGRSRVEKMLNPMGNKSQGRHLPLLSTLEMFKLKWAVPTAETSNYVSLSRSERQEYLEKLKSVPREQVGTNGTSGESPIQIDKIEWFASPKENCKAMFWLATQKSPELRKVLSISTPSLIDVNSPSSHWDYAGFKGGSEPGVFSMTYVLETKTGQRACLSMSWNNQKKSLSEVRMMDLVAKTLKWAETVVK